MSCIHNNRLLLFFGLLLLLAGCQKKAEQKALRIATAANMQYAMEAITEAFEKETGFRCEVILGSSGKLFAQIREGAPYDLFLSADLKYPETLHDLGLTAAPPRIYANGQLVLWTLSDALTPSLEGLKSDTIAHIALANPKTAPYGRAAMEVLAANGLYDSLQKKLVYGESIAQTNQFITSGAATAGFTSLGTVLSPEMKGKGHWIPIDRNTHSPIEQGVVLLEKKNGKHLAAESFYAFLFSPKGKEILQNFGYSANE